MKCDYKNSLQVCRGDANAEAKFKVTLFYHREETDVLFLCVDCTKYVTVDASKYDYEWEVLSL